MSPALRDMLARVERQGGLLLESQIAASGGRASRNLDALLREGLVEIVEHPTVREGARRVPAAAVKITERGKSALYGLVNRPPESPDRSGREPRP